MKRDPSIHVKRSSLIEALADIIQEDPVSTARELFHKLNKDAIRNRVVIQPKAATAKKMKRVASVDKDLAESFHAVYQQVNMLNSIKTSSIKSTDGKYATLKEVALQAKEFCDMFKLDQDQGFKLYITTAIRLAGNNYSIYRLKALADKIINEYQDMLTISEDGDQESTTTFYAAWKNVSIKYLGISTSITEPHLFVHFIHAKNAANKQKADFVDWIAAQFEGLADFSSAPSLQQLYGDNATLRYTKYMGTKSKEYKNDTEKKYFEKGKVKPKTIKRKNSAKKA